jgi:hypothetical protein
MLYTCQAKARSVLQRYIACYLTNHHHAVSAAKQLLALHQAVSDTWSASVYHLLAGNGIRQCMLVPFVSTNICLDRC